MECPNCADECMDDASGEESEETVYQCKSCSLRIYVDLGIGIKITP